MQERDADKTNRRPSIPPGEGERRAQRGLVPQYKIAAEKVLGLLTGGRLHEIAIADPHAGTLEDVQTVRRQGAQLILDAYQVKWSKPGETLIESEFRSLLADLVQSRRAVTQAAHGRAEDGAEKVDCVIAHLYTNRVASTAGLRGRGVAGEELSGEGRTLHAFLDQVWHSAQRGAAQRLDDVDSRWHGYLRLLGECCGLAPDELLASAPDLRIELDRELEEDELDPSDWQTRNRLKDLADIRVTLQDLVSDRDVEWVWLSAEELVEQLGPEWSARWRPRLDHAFPTSGPYEPIAASVAALSRALDRFDCGYVVLTGSPGSGKSTLLTRLLRNDERLAARYYAYVPGGDSVSRGEASSFLHDLYLAIGGRQGQRVLAPRTESLEDLRTAFVMQLEALGRRAHERGRTEVVLVDGLDHVVRDPRPHHPLLSELPPAEQVPEGVLLVLGTRSLADLPSHVRRSVRDGRHVELAPLQRAAVLRLCERAGMMQLGERIAELSDGHPLLVRTYLKLAEELPDRQRETMLSKLPASGGEIWDFYEGIWAPLADQPEVIDLLALISRLRGPIRFSWLAATGTPSGDLARLDGLRHLFDTRDRERWRFFHSSFREFLLRRTAERDDRLDTALHRAVHRELAERCRKSPADAPERFDELHHLLQAAEDEQALARATPAFFREQVDAMRPRDEIADDLRAAASALVERPDGLAAARLALSAHELQVRGYQFPEDQEFLDLLVALDLPEHAVAHLRAVDNGTVGHDRRLTAMRLAQTLDDAGHVGSALRVFEEHEPLDWLGGPTSPLRDSPSGPFGALYAWSRTAAQLRGSAYLLEMVPRLREPVGVDRFERVELPKLSANLLWSAADELVRLGDLEQATALRAALVACGETGRDLVAMLDLSLALAVSSDDERIAALNALDSDALPNESIVDFAEALLDLGQRERAQQIIAGCPAPGMPDRAGREDVERRGWTAFYRYWRLLARQSGRPDASEAVPESARDYLQPVVIGARHLVVMAGLESRWRAGDDVGITEVLAALRTMHAWWDSPRDNRDDMWRPGRAVGLASRRAVALAAAMGEDELRQLLGYFEARWDSQPGAVRSDGGELVSWLARHGAGRLTLRRALERIEAALEDSAWPSDWVELGPAWLALGEPGAASRCLRRAVRLTLSPSSDKDIQLATWIRLMGPLLHGPNGPALGDCLVAALIALERRASGGSPDYAARTLLDVLVPENPDEAWRLTGPLLDARVVQIDEVVAALLDGSAHRATSTWWIVAGELQVVMGVGPLRRALTRAAEADSALATTWLPVLAERVGVEGRPSERRAWREALLDAGGAAGLSANQVSITSAELEVSHEAPEVHRGGSGDEPSSSPSVLSLLADAERQDAAPHERDDAVRKLSRRLDELDHEQLARLLSAGLGTESEPTLRARLAAAALAAGDYDEAWAQGLAALRSSSSGDWSRHWAGGPMLDLIPLLLELDRPRARQAVLERFSDLAGDVDYFLGSVGQSLDDYVQALELPEVELARDALEVARALLRDVAPLPDPTALQARDLPLTARGDPEAAFEALIGYLLGLEQTVAWQAAQRALLGLARLRLGFPAIRAGLSDSSETALRACAVVQAAADHLTGDDALAERLGELAASPRLDVRVAAAASMDALGRPAGPLRMPRELPAALRLELPPRNQHRRVVGALETSLGYWRPQIEALARLADIDEDALHDRVLLRARVMVDGLQDIDRLPNDDSALGWGYVKPSARATRIALAEAASELLDARGLDAGEALRAIELHPPVDPGLLQHRPIRRPADVATFVPHHARSRLYSRELAELAAGSVDRLARSHEGWAVLAEHTEVGLLDRPGHHEIRRSGLVRAGVAEVPTPHLILVPLTVLEYGGLSRSGPVDHGIVRPFEVPAATPNGWLALHPRLAGSMVLDLSDPGWLDWTLDARPAVRSLWWRSGYMRWSPYSEDDEVGEGWLVLGTPEFVERLCADGWELAYEVSTRRRGDDDADEQEVMARGTRALSRRGSTQGR